jgi:hypothetical protein
MEMLNRRADATLFIQCRDDNRKERKSAPLAFRFSRVASQTGLISIICHAI